jgi:mRNA-degrading endonuclease RelE of RelBE toxin-antitoxin system
MRENPFGGDVVRLKGQQETAWRRRVGDWRILYDIYVSKRLIVVTAIVRRTTTTY